MGLYILNDKREPIPETDALKWGKWFQFVSNRMIERTEAYQVGHDEPEAILISTVFMGIDHGFGGKVILYETMVFGGKEDGLCWRYETEAQAREGHQKAVRKVMGEEEPERSEPESFLND